MSTTPTSRRTTKRLLGAATVICLLSSCGADNTADLEAAEANVEELASGLAATEQQVVDAEDELATTAADLATAEAALATAETDLETASADLATEIGRTSELEANVEELAAARDTAITERDDAIAEADALKVRYDPEIQAAIAGAQQAAADAACVAADTAGFEGVAKPDGQTFADQAAAGLPDGTAVDVAAINVRIDECFAAGEQRLAAEALMQPKGDGIWTVGLEIAAGKWRSNGTGDSCYWQRSPDGSPDDITDNHFGNAGGSVTLRAGEEFETTRCGTWEFAG